MSLNLNNDSSEESSNIVDVSSDDEDVVSPKIDIPINEHPERPGTSDTPTHCTICFEKLTNKCYSDSCWHMFCFECLKRWSTIESSCPLCKKTFKVIHHTFTGQSLHETYVVPSQETDIIFPSVPLQPFSEITDVNGMNLLLDVVPRNERFSNNVNQLRNIDHNHNASFTHVMESNIINITRSFEIQNNYLGHLSTMRIRVYIENVWADPLPDLSGRFRDCTSAFYRENPAQTHRLQQFIIRDITAIRLINTDLIDVVTPLRIITNLILRSILNFDIRDANLATVLTPYLREYTSHFCHELRNFANSPYDMIGYDRNVHYSVRHDVSLFQSELNATDMFEPTSVSLELIPVTNNQNEVIVLDSDDELQEILPTCEEEPIVLSSSNNSEDEIHSDGIITYNIEDSDSPEEQPSTSIGIRDSREQLNNRRGDTIVLDSSTDDEVTISSQAVHKKYEVICCKRKRKIKTNNMRKKNRRTLDEYQTEKHFRRRNRSCSESSTSSGDTIRTR